MRLLGKQAGGFLFCFFLVKGCGVGLGFGLILFPLYQFPKLASSKKQEDGWLTVQTWITKAVWSW